MTIAPGDSVGLLRELVRIDSRNPGLVPGALGEGPIARSLAAVLQAWGFDVTLADAAPGRPNVLARVGPAGKRTLMFNGHIDVVGVDGMVHAPFDGVEVDGRLYARGASDMKGGVAAMCGAAARAMRQGLDCELIIAAVVDEEFESAGTRALIASGVRADAAIVTEPTQLAIGPAHRGFTWAEFECHGRAAHGSRYDIGVDAIMHAAAVLQQLQTLDATELSARTHPLLGHASLHASTITGGSGWSTYPERCVLRVERRTLPGETADTVMEEFQQVCDAAMQSVAGLVVQVRHVFTQSPSDVSVQAPVVRALGASLEACGQAAPIAGVSAWTDAALLNHADIPAICFGPGDMGLAHAAEEWIVLSQVERATETLTHLACTWSSAR